MDIEVVSEGLPSSWEKSQREPDHGRFPESHWSWPIWISIIIDNYIDRDTSQKNGPCLACGLSGGLIGFVQPNPHPIFYHQLLFISLSYIYEHHVTLPLPPNTPFLSHTCKAHTNTLVNGHISLTYISLDLLSHFYIFDFIFQ